MSTSYELADGDPPSRSVGEPSSGRMVGTPAPDVLAFRSNDAYDPYSSVPQGERPRATDSFEQYLTSDDAAVSPATTAESNDDTSADTDPLPGSSQPPLTPATPKNAASSSSTGPSTKSTTTTAAPRTAAPPKSTPPTTAPRATSTTQKKEATTTTTTTKKAAATTTTTEKKAPATTTGVSSGPGCKKSCQSVGFQDLRNKSDVVLENLIISNPNGRCIDLTNAKNITIRNVTIRNCGTDKAVPSSYDTGLIQIEDAKNITVEASLIDNMSAERFGRNRNNAFQIKSSSNIKIRNNSIRNIRSDIGDKSDDRGARAIKIEGSVANISIDQNSFFNAGRNAVQISRVQSAPGISITGNQIAGRGRWDSDYEDMINLYSASGTAQSPIRIANNHLKNGGPSSTGTGMILGDGKSSAGKTQYIIAENNRLVDPGHVGINLAGGDNITVRNNTIVGRGNVPLKTTTGFTINDYGYTGSCSGHVVTGNRVWMDNQHVGGTNHVWNPGTCKDGNRIEGNTFGDASLR